MWTFPVEIPNRGMIERLNETKRVYSIKVKASVNKKNTFSDLINIILKKLSGKPSVVSFLLKLDKPRIDDISHLWSVISLGFSSRSDKMIIQNCAISHRYPRAQKNRWMTSLLLGAYWSRMSCQNTHKHTLTETLVLWWGIEIKS